MGISERIRPGIEAAPWVCVEVGKLEASYNALTAQNERMRAAITTLADTELRELACVGSHAPVEDALGRLFALVPND